MTLNRRVAERISAQFPSLSTGELHMILLAADSMKSTILREDRVREADAELDRANQLRDKRQSGLVIRRTRAFAFTNDRKFEII